MGLATLGSVTSSWLQGCEHLPTPGWELDGKVRVGEHGRQSGCAERVLLSLLGWGFLDKMGQMSLEDMLAILRPSLTKGRKG